jgi:hypothetical protein
MLSEDQGDSWRMLGFPANFYVTDIMETAANTTLVSAQSSLFDKDEGGVWRSADGGATWQQVQSPLITNAG